MKYVLLLCVALFACNKEGGPVAAVTPESDPLVMVTDGSYVINNFTVIWYKVTNVSSKVVDSVYLSYIGVGTLAGDSLKHYIGTMQPTQIHRVDLLGNNVTLHWKK